MRIPYIDFQSNLDVEVSMGESMSQRPHGWFSKRHQGDGPHREAQSRKQAKLDAKRATAIRIARERAGRDARQQVIFLDGYLGVGVGAIRERRRLALHIAAQDAEATKMAAKMAAETMAAKQPKGNRRK